MTPKASVSRLSRRRAFCYVAFLSAYPVFPLVVGMVRPLRTPRLPPTVSGLVDLIVLEMAVFAAWVSAGWVLGRPTRDELLAKCRGGQRAIARGLVEGLGIWIGVSVLLGGAAHLIAGGLHLGAAAVEALRPHAERIVPVEVLRNNPAYLLVTTTLVSFGLAGLREELWRSALLHGLHALLPRSVQSPSAALVPVCASACLFGLGHWPQGVGGVLMTTALGVAFGLILVRHRSLWEAVVAHGAFDA
jgi:membrane protease YdiL (CAAX protease family)